MKPLDPNAFVLTDAVTAPEVAPAPSRPGVMSRARAWLPRPSIDPALRLARMRRDAQLEHLDMDRMTAARAPLIR